MRLIRNNIFETNSSSTHSLVMCMKKDMDDWRDGKKFFVPELEKIVSEGEELDNYIRQQIVSENLVYQRDGDKVWYEYKKKKYNTKEELYEEVTPKITAKEISTWKKKDNDPYCSPLTHEEYFDNYIADCGYESFEETFVTPNGEEVTAFGYYGADY